MIRFASVLRLTVSALALLPGAVLAQNYVAPNAFNGPNVVIDFGTLDQASNISNQWAVAPVQEESLPLVPPRLNPPVPKQQMAIMPIGETPAMAAQPFANQPPVAAPAPVAHQNELPPPADFHARDTLSAQNSPLPTPSSIEQDLPPVVQKAEAETKTHAMLNQARSIGNDSRDRINLASINSTPPAAPRTTAPLGIMAEKTSAGSAVVASPKNTSGLPMPPQADLGDLQDDLPAPTGKPMQIASLPPSVAPDKKPASPPPSAAGQQFALNFAKGNGTLDATAKAELDKLIKAMKADPTLRAQVRAYASGTPETSGQARRLSLTRAVAARSYIMDQGIAATRLDMRALGTGQAGIDKPEGSLDKAEITLVK